MPTLQETYNTCLFHSTTALSRTLTRMAEEQFGPLGLTPTMGFILITARAAPGILISDLALVHQLDVSTISRALDKLVAAQFALREGAHKNIRVFVTPKGERKEAEAQSAWNKLQQAYTLILSEPEARKLAGEVTAALIPLRTATTKPKDTRS